MIRAEILVSEHDVESIADRHNGETASFRIEEPEPVHGQPSVRRRVRHSGSTDTRWK
jgi:hypothetical protein